MCRNDLFNFLIGKTDKIPFRSQIVEYSNCSWFEFETCKVLCIFKHDIYNEEYIYRCTLILWLRQPSSLFITTSSCECFYRRRVAILFAKPDQSILPITRLVKTALMCIKYIMQINGRINFAFTIITYELLYTYFQALIKSSQLASNVLLNVLTIAVIRNIALDVFTMVHNSRISLL